MDLYATLVDLVLEEGEQRLSPVDSIRSVQECRGEALDGIFGGLGLQPLEGPAENELSRTVIVSSHQSEPMVNESGLPTPAQTTMVRTFTS